jgi:glycogen debranching enzyme
MQSAFRIARNNLQACFREEGIVASVDHYSDFWARDSFYASWGLLATGEYGKVRDNLRLFIRYQKKNGHIPRRIDRFIVPLKYLGLKIRRREYKPRYTGVYIYPALDSNLLFVITLEKYARESGDVRFLKENKEVLWQALAWVERYEKKGLLDEGLFANWADIIIKKGKVLYTNILYAAALDRASRLAYGLAQEERARYYEKKACAAKGLINREYWNGKYYIDWIYKKKKYDYLSTDGNVLAMLFGISDQKQNQEMVRNIERWSLDEIPMKTNYPSYAWWRVKLITRVIGAPGYQNNHTSWLWLGCIYAVALHEQGHEEKAKVIAKRIAEKIQEYRKVYELYGPDGVPYRGWYWRSASSFAWSSGLYLWMYKILDKKPKPR